MRIDETWQTIGEAWQLLNMAPVPQPDGFRILKIQD